MASWLVGLTLDLSSLGLSLASGQCVVFSGKTLHSHSASLHPGVFKWIVVNLILGVILQ